MSTWTTPITWTVGQKPTKAQMDAEIRDHANYMKSALDVNGILVDTAKSAPTFALYGARVFKAAAQTITNTTTTAINFDTERFDSNAFHDNVTNNTRLTIPASAGGYYLIGFNIAFVAGAGVQRYVDLIVNATTAILVQQTPNNSSASMQLTGATLWNLAATDFVECRVFQDSGGNLDVVASGGSSPEFWIHRLSST